MRMVGFLAVILGLCVVGCGGVGDDGSDENFTPKHTLPPGSSGTGSGCPKCDAVYQDCLSKGIPADSCSATASACLNAGSC
jgi:hypothetical protein